MDTAFCSPVPAHDAPDTRTASSWLRLGEAIALPAVSLHFARNEEIFGEGEASERVYRVSSGAVRAARFLEDGRRQVGAFYLPGDIFGLEAGEVHRFTAEAVVDSAVIAVRRAAMERALSADAKGMRQLWTLTADHLAQAQDQLLLLGRKSALERVSAFLLDMAKRQKASRTVSLAMSRHDIADYLGLTIETVSRSLTQLERANIIALPSSRRIVLHDRTALAAA